MWDEQQARAIRDGNVPDLDTTLRRCEAEQAELVAALRRVHEEILAIADPTAPHLGFTQADVIRLRADMYALVHGARAVGVDGPPYMGLAELDRIIARLRTLRQKEIANA